MLEVMWNFSNVSRHSRRHPALRSISRERCNCYIFANITGALRLNPGLFPRSRADRCHSKFATASRALGRESVLDFLLVFLVFHDTLLLHYFLALIVSRFSPLESIRAVSAELMEWIGL